MTLHDASVSTPRSRLIDTLIIAAITASVAYTADVAPALPPRTEPFYITPQIQHLSLTDPALLLRLKKLLNRLEPHGAQGQMQIGYTLTFPLYSYFKQTHGAWTFDDAPIRASLIEAAKLQRPFVVYLAADHFFGDSPYGAYLASLPQSLMQFQDGSVPKESYFTTGLVPFRISNDEKLPHIRAKFEALGIVALQLEAFRKQHPELLVGITMNGETHYMFENFFSGTGNFATPRYTDFSPDAISDFAAYLTAHHQQNSSASDIKKMDLTRYPWGSYPFFGWYCAASPNEKIAIYHNGKRLGSARMRINRMDVYNALPKAADANCGFRYDIDFSTWKHGDHRIEAVLEHHGKRYGLDNNQLVLRLGKNGDSTATPPQQLPAIASIGRRGYVDRGSSSAVLIDYIPLARQWMRFREESIVSHQEKMSAILTKAGIPSELLYNYQLPTWMNGDWNTALFGVGQDFFTTSTLRAGITLYGGNTLNPTLHSDLPQGKPYGIPEFHPQMEHTATIAEDSLRYHYAHGARFLSPYFMSNGDNIADKTEHHYMIITPTNTHMGSDALYRAIQKLAAY